MDWKRNMNEQEELQWAEEYDTRIMIFQAEFKNNFCVSPMVGFCPKRFVGTRKEWDINVAPWYESESRGKIIGVFYEDFNDVESDFAKNAREDELSYLKIKKNALINERNYKLKKLSDDKRRTRILN